MKSTNIKQVIEEGDTSEAARQRTTERLIHEAGLGPLVAHLAVEGRSDLTALLVAHLHEVERMARRLVELGDAQAQARRINLPPAMSEADLTIPRPAVELAALLGISRTRVADEARAGRGRIERIEADLPGSNGRYLYRCTGAGNLRMGRGRPARQDRAGGEESGAQAH